MQRCTGILPVVLAVGLVLPLPGTEGRGRDFCTAWLALGRGERQDVLRAAEEREAGPAYDAECRAGLRSGLRHTLDAECANWRRLMDFEVRAIVDRVLEPCRRDGA